MQNPNPSADAAETEHAYPRTGSSQMRGVSSCATEVLKTASSRRKQGSSTTTTQLPLEPKVSNSTGAAHGNPGSGRSQTSNHETGTALQTVKATSSVRCVKSLPLVPRVQVNDLAAGTEQAALMLARLTVHDRSRADWPEARWTMLWEDYLEVLAPYPAHEIDLGIQHWLREGKPWFPSLAELIQAMREGHQRWLY